MNKISTNEALSILKSKPSSFASVTYESSQDKLNKGRGKGNTMLEVLGIDPDKIVKRTTATVLVGTKISYQTLVENRLGREADLKGIEAQDFDSAPLPWGEKVDGVEITHKGEQYVRLYFVSANPSIVSYTYEGKEIDLNDAKFDAFRKAEKIEGQKQIDAGIDKVVVPRTVNIGNFKGMTYGGQTYEIVK